MQPVSWTQRGYPLPETEETKGAWEKVKDWAKNTTLYLWSVQTSGGLDFFVDSFLQEDGNFAPFKRITVAHKINAHGFTSYDYWPLFRRCKGEGVSNGDELNKLKERGIGPHTPLTIDNKEYHKPIKRLCMNSMRSTKIDKFFPAIYSVVDSYFNSVFFSKENPGAFNLSEHIIQVISRANVLAVFGPPGSESQKKVEKLIFTKDGIPNPEWDEVPSAVEAVGQSVSDWALNDPKDWCLRLVDTFIPKSLYQTDYQKQNDILNKAVRKICQASKNGSVRKVKGIIEEMLDKDFSPEQIESIAKLILVIGQRTTAFTIESCFKNLILFPEWQERLYNEIQETVKGEEIASEHLKAMKDLDNFIWETLRLNPPVPIQTRQTEDDIKFKGISIPPKTTIAFIHYAAQRDPELFPEPNQFNPDRFSGGGASLKNKIKTFSQDSHNCCGRQLAMRGTIKATLVNLIRKTKIRAADIEEVVNMHHVGGIILKHGSPLRVRFEKRD